MMRFLSIISLFIAPISVIAQTESKLLFVGHVISDTASFNTAYSPLASDSIRNSQHKIEIRFITNITWSRPEWIILTFDESWSASHHFYKEDNDTLFSIDITQKSNLDTLFVQLVANNIFSLGETDCSVPGKSEFNPQTNTLISHGMGIGDGTCYTLEFKISDCARRYCYCNPAEFSSFYPHVHDLREFANIVTLFERITK